MKRFIAIMCITMLGSCSGSSSKYYFIDKDHTLHTNKSCKWIYKSVFYIPKEDIKSDHIDIEGFCSHCMDEKDYEDFVEFLR